MMPHKISCWYCKGIMTTTWNKGNWIEWSDTMTPYGIPPQYNPKTLTTTFTCIIPNCQHKTANEAADHTTWWRGILATVKQRMPSAQFVSSKTGNAYKWDNNDMLVSFGPRYESWWPVDDTLPAGELVELDKVG